MSTGSTIRLLVILCGVALLAPVADSGAEPVVDGILDTAYGPPLSVQSTQTSLGDYLGDGSLGSELDAANAIVEDGKLWLFIACSLNRYFTEFLYPPNVLHVFIDTRSGGQSPLSADNTSPPGFVRLQGMAGLTFDAEFIPDYWLAVARDGGAGTTFSAYFAELPSGVGATGYFLGTGSLGPPGTLDSTGAVNPYGILASFDRSNVGGVGEGCGSSSGVGVTVGLEWSVPLAALGDPTGPLRICVMLTRNYGEADQVSNQVLGPVPPGTCALGPAAGVNLDGVPGRQYFGEQAVAGIPDPQRGGARLWAPMPNPSRGAVRFRLDMPSPRRTRVEVVDVEGRSVRLIADDMFSPGPTDLSWDGLDSSGRPAPAGLYLLVAGSGSERQSRRFVRLR
jgi:FlgD Ig-like domain